MQTGTETFEYTPLLPSLFCSLTETVGHRAGGKLIFPPRKAVYGPCLTCINNSTARLGDIYKFVGTEHSVPRGPRLWSHHPSSISMGTMAPMALVLAWFCPTKTEGEMVLFLGFYIASSPRHCSTGEELGETS